MVGQKKHANTTYKATKHIERTFLTSDYYLYNYKKWKIVASTIVLIKRVLLKKNFEFVLVWSQWTK